MLPTRRVGLRKEIGLGLRKSALRVVSHAKLQRLNFRLRRFEDRPPSDFAHSPEPCTGDRS